ncbi:MAG: S41 family peptidase [Christensenellales bacterium]
MALAPEDQPPDPLAITWADGSVETFPLTTPYRYALSTSQIDNTYTVRNGIPILRVPRMAMGDFDAPYAERMQQLLRWIGQMRQQPVSILDLRGNAGGMLRLGEIIVAAYSGRAAEKTFACAVEGAAPAPDDPTLNTDAWDIAFSDEGASIAGHFFPIQEQPRTLILLVDKNTVSAGEALCSFALNTRGMHALLVGSNTAGTLRNNSGREYFLPNTHLRIRLGDGLYLWPGDVCRETVGILPDLWVQGNSLEAVLALLEP